MKTVEESLFINRIIENFQIPYIWIPLAVVMLYVIFKNSKIQTFILSVGILLAGVVTAKILGFHLCALWIGIIFLSFLIKSKQLTIILTVWGSITSFVFLHTNTQSTPNVYYEIVGGVLMGTFVYWLYKLVFKRFKIQINCISNQYTSSGYLIEDIRFLHAIMLLTYFYIMILSLID